MVSIFSSLTTYRLPFTTNKKFMLKKLYLLLGIGVLLVYASSAWFGWEFANSGSRSRFGMPFIYGGYRGGK
jgi:hypothetical protein